MSESNLEHRSFDANVNKLLNLMINYLYTNKDVSIRELVSNAVDACEKIKYMSLTDDTVLDKRGNLQIEIKLDIKNNTITIKDNGIGMNKDDLIHNLGVIANSGTENFFNALEDKKVPESDLIGYFGVGFYSIFMIADFVVIKSKKACSEKSYKWSSNGVDSYTIEEIDEDILGTSITATIKNNESKYLDIEYIKSILEKYSSYLSFPIVLTEIKEDNTISTSDFNSKGPIWKRDKKDVKKEDYLACYREVANAFDEPWMTLHNHHDGVVRFSNLLFIPSKNFLSPVGTHRKSGIKFYINKVFISNAKEEIFPNYLRFVSGIIEIDRDSISLNISRENFQQDDANTEKVKRILINKIISELGKKQKADIESYLEFWNNFGSILKEGIYEDISVSKDILNISLFYSAIHKKYISLSEYVSSIPDGKDRKIFYLTGEKIEQMLVSPQIEGFLSEGVDVLLMNDAVDSFVVSIANNYDNATFVSVATSGLKSSRDNNEQNTSEHQELIKYFKSCLGNKIADVKISKKLISSPVCLAIEEGGMDIRMERILMNQGRNLTKKLPRHLEINLNHSIIKKINEHVLGTKECKNADDIVNLLLDQALLIEGEQIEDVKSFCDRLNNSL